jgi:acetyl-CoA acetyltransferase
MGVTAENLAEQYNITRQNSDEFALSSQQKWASANEAGAFTPELAPVEIESRRQTITIEYVAKTSLLPLLA